MRGPLSSHELGFVDAASYAGAAQDLSAVGPPALLVEEGPSLPRDYFAAVWGLRADAARLEAVVAELHEFLASAASTA